MDVAVKKLTWEDIKDYPEYHGRTEIVDGELVVSPVPSRKHQWSCQNLALVVVPFLRSRDLGRFYSLPVHVILDDHVNYEPDCCFIAKGRLQDEESAAYEGPPDLIVEVISASNRRPDTETKFRHYERYGVREYWLVDRYAKWIEVWFLEGGKYWSLGRFTPGQRVVTRVLEGLELDPAQVL